MSEKVKTILVADDEADIREAIAAALEADGFTVLEASDGKTAVATALKEAPDLIMLDIQMPELSGTEALRELRADTTHALTPIIMLTAQSDLNYISEALELGGTNFTYLTKTDWKLSDVVAKVHEQLHK